MSSALKPGRPIRYRPSSPGTTKPPECAGIYYIYDGNGNLIYTGQSVNLRRRVYEHKRNGRIPDGGYVDCIKAKEGISYYELDATERAKIDKHNPPSNQRAGGGGRKSSKLNRPSLEHAPEQKRSILYRLLGYEKVDKSGDVHYTKEPKAKFFMVIELIVKLFLIATTLSAILGIFLKMSKGLVINQYVIIGTGAIPILCFIMFHYIRNNKAFKVMSIIALLASIVLYFAAYPLPVDLPF